MFATTAWHQLAARLAVRLLRCNRVQPFFVGILRSSSGNKFWYGGAAFAWCFLGWLALVLAPKRSKKPGLKFISDWVQLILKKLVAPYLLC
jgi:hypothetical protein